MTSPVVLYLLYGIVWIIKYQYSLLASMDRITYLSSLPFVIPLQSKVWPPMMNGQIVLGCPQQQQQQQPKKKNDEYYAHRSAGGTSSGTGVGSCAWDSASATTTAQIPFVVSIELVSPQTGEGL